MFIRYHFVWARYSLGNQVLRKVPPTPRRKHARLAFATVQSASFCSSIPTFLTFLKLRYILCMIYVWYPYISSQSPRSEQMGWVVRGSMELAPGTVLYSNKTSSFLRHLILPSPQWIPLNRVAWHRSQAMGFPCCLWLDGDLHISGSSWPPEEAPSSSSPEPQGRERRGEGAGRSLGQPAPGLPSP